jgi:serine/threonine-protein kinase RsbT
MGTDVSGELSIKTANDVVAARRSVRDAAVQLGFGETDVTRIVTATSELARNIFKYAGQGVMRWRLVQANGRSGLELQFVDQGPGIADIHQAFRDGYSTSGGMGMGLPGAKRLMDQFEIESVVGQGTSVTMKKWLKA